MEKPNSLDELYAFLKRFHLADSLLEISKINAALRFGDREIYRPGIPKDILTWLGRMQEFRRTNVMLEVTRMARYLILSGANDYRNVYLHLQDRNFYTAVNMTGFLYDKDVEIKDDAPLDVGQLMGRIAHWQFSLQDTPKYIIARGYLLFSLIGSRHQGKYDITAKMKEHYCVGALEFMGAGLFHWFLSDGTLEEDIQLESDLSGSIVTVDALNRFILLSQGTYKDYRVAIRGINWQEKNKLHEIYGLDPFVKMPIIKVDKPGHMKSPYVVPQLKYLLDRASSGIFYLLADKEREIAGQKGKKHENHFRRAFGDMYREYVGLQLSQPNVSIKFVDLDTDLQLPPTIKRPDFALISGTCCLLFEVKTSLLNVNARTYFEKETLRQAIASGSLEKAVGQLKQFQDLVLSEYIKDPRFHGIKRVTSFLVGYEAIYVLNLSVLPLLKEYYGDLVARLQLADISDIDTIGRAVGMELDVVCQLDEKVSDRDKELWGVATYLNERNTFLPNPLLDKAYEEFMTLLIGQERIRHMTD